jgi:hypothetical protein
MYESLQRFKRMQVIIVAGVPGHVYIYPNSVGHTIKGLALIEYENND